MTKISEINIARQILSGHLDEQLTRIESAVQSRKKLLREMESSELVVGDRVTFIDNIKPKYLGTVTAKIEKSRGDGKLVIRPEPWHTMRLGRYLSPDGTMISPRTLLKRADR